MANEVQVQLNGTKKRCDTVLYRRDLTARMIVEYKAPEIEITQKVFGPDYPLQQVQRDYLIVSNGLQHYCRRIDYESTTAILFCRIYLSKTYRRSLPIAPCPSSHRIIYHA